MSSTGFNLDLSEPFEHLANAPIVEAVIHWRARSGKVIEPVVFLGQLREKLPDYEVTEPSEIEQLGVRFINQGVTTMRATQYGESQAAKFVRDQLERHTRSLHESAAIGIEKVIREELADVWEECREPNWDGHDALPVTWDAYRNSADLLLSLPFGIPAPSVGAEPDGHITLEWHHSRRRTLSVSISPDDQLHYAALLGAGNARGTEPFFGEVPQRILALICDVYSC
jgi:hypothetical protein